VFCLSSGTISFVKAESAGAYLHTPLPPSLIRFLHSSWPPTKLPTNHEMKIRPVPTVGSARRSYGKGPQRSGGHDGVRQFFNWCTRSCGGGGASAAAQKNEYYTRGAAPQLLVHQLKIAQHHRDPPDRCGPFPHGRRADRNMGTGLILILQLVGGFVGGHDECKKRISDGGRGGCKYAPALSALRNEIVPDDRQNT